MDQKQLCVAKMMDMSENFSEEQLVIATVALKNLQNFWRLFESGFVTQKLLDLLPN